MVFGSNFEVFQEVIVEEEIQDVNVENSRSNSPSSVTNEMYSNENSVSSYAASETHNKYSWTREDLTPSEVLPDNLFTENEEDIKSFGLDPTVDTSVNISDNPGFALNALFQVKEEPGVTEDAKVVENTEENVKKVPRRKIKQEPTEAVEAPE